MLLKDSLVLQGNWLFRWRSYTPLLVLLTVFAAIHSFTYPYGNHNLDTVADFLAFGVALIGLGIRVLTVGFVPRRTSGRNTREQVADTVNTTGMYSLMRHPLYFGNFLIWFGASLFLRLWWFSAIVTLAYFLLYERIMIAEENFLAEKFGNRYQTWAAKTPAFFPDFRLWKRPVAKFSWRTVLRRENATLYGIVVIFTLLEILGTVHVEHKLVIDTEWAVVFGAGTALYLALKFLKRRKLLGSG